MSKNNYNNVWLQALKKIWCYKKSSFSVIIIIALASMLVFSFSLALTGIDTNLQSLIKDPRQNFFYLNNVDPKTTQPTGFDQKFINSLTPNFVQSYLGDFDKKNQLKGDMATVVVDKHFFGEFQEIECKDTEICIILPTSGYLALANIAPEEYNSKNMDQKISIQKLVRPKWLGKTVSLDWEYSKKTWYSYLGEKNKDLPPDAETLTDAELLAPIKNKINAKIVGFLPMTGSSENLINSQTGIVNSYIWVNKNIFNFELEDYTWYQYKDKNVALEKMFVANNRQESGTTALEFTRIQELRDVLRVLDKIKPLLLIVYVVMILIILVISQKLVQESKIDLALFVMMGSTKAALIKIFVSYIFLVSIIANLTSVLLAFALNSGISLVIGKAFYAGASGLIVDLTQFINPLVFVGFNILELFAIICINSAIIVSLAVFSIYKLNTKSLISEIKSN